MLCPFKNRIILCHEGAHLAAGEDVRGGLALKGPRFSINIEYTITQQIKELVTK